MKGELWILHFKASEVLFWNELGRSISINSPGHIVVLFGGAQRRCEWVNQKGMMTFGSAFMVIVTRVQE